MVFEKTIGTILRYHRKKAGLTQIELADLAGVGKASIFEIEQGHPTVKLETLHSVCRALNIDICLDSPLIKNPLVIDSDQIPDHFKE